MNSYNSSEDLQNFQTLAERMEVKFANIFHSLTLEQKFRKQFGSCWVLPNNVLLLNNIIFSQFFCLLSICWKTKKAFLRKTCNSKSNFFYSVNMKNSNTNKLADDSSKHSKFNQADVSKLIQFANIFHSLVHQAII